MILSHGGPRETAAQLAAAAAQNIAATPNATTPAPNMAGGALQTAVTAAPNVAPKPPDKQVAPAAGLQVVPFRALPTMDPPVHEMPKASKANKSAFAKRKADEASQVMGVVPTQKKAKKERKPHVPFAERIRGLLQYKAENGHLRLPYGYDGGQRLSEWVKNVRRGAKKLTIAERQKLNEIGFIWETGKNRHARQWNEKFEQLQAYKRRFGDCLIPWQWHEDKQLAEVCCLHHSCSV